MPSEVATRRCMGWAPVCAQPVVGTARESVSAFWGISSAILAIMPVGAVDV